MSKILMSIGSDIFSLTSRKHFLKPLIHKVPQKIIGADTKSCRKTNNKLSTKFTVK
jgi:hypothetical protein